VRRCIPSKTIIHVCCAGLPDGIKRISKWENSGIFNQHAKQIRNFTKSRASICVSSCAGLTHWRCISPPLQCHGWLCLSCLRARHSAHADYCERVRNPSQTCLIFCRLAEAANLPLRRQPGVSSWHCVFDRRKSTATPCVCLSFGWQEITNCSD
jgi:hypothetical protein